MQTFDFIVVGGGIVGLTIAWELKQVNPKSTILVLEKESSAGLHASGRNSGVLHSGIYYGSDTLKAKVCSSGARKMREFATEHGIRFERSGKVIIATSESDLSILDKLLKNAKDSNINAEKLSASEIRKIEPYANPYQCGIYTPDTSIIDSRSVVDKLCVLLKERGVEFLFSSQLLDQDKKRRTVKTHNQEFSYGHLYNCSGANADTVAKLFGAGLKYSMLPFKGTYYKLHPNKRHLVKGNIYPVPNIKLPFLGVHLTRVINGNVYVGPTAIPALGRENYRFFEGVGLKEGLEIASELAWVYLKNKENFRELAHTEIRKYLKPWFARSAQNLIPNIEYKDLLPSDKVGIRPQLINIKTKSIETDYIVEHTSHTTHVLNSISPAFTSSFALAEWIVGESR